MSFMGKSNIIARLVVLMGIILAGPIASSAQKPKDISETAKKACKRIGPTTDICVVLGLPPSETPHFVTDLARGSELILFFQSTDPTQIAQVRQVAEETGFLGSRVFVDRGSFDSIPLADNLAGVVLVADAVKTSDAELLRVLHPEGRALWIGSDRQLVKPFPEGTDSWSHPYHGPDNNPQSTDRLARWPCMTQFLGYPLFVPMPEVSVAAGGRVFRAFGHIAHRANQNESLNRLICTSGYNGLILWERPLREGFMIHRNTMIATPELLYLADDVSCKRIDTRTGRVVDEITLPSNILADGPVWKWMALDDGVLYALFGGKEASIATQRSDHPAMGHWPWGMWEGHDYKSAKTNFGFGRTLVALDPDTKKVLWSHREEAYLDSRGICAKGDRIYYYSPEKFLACLDTKQGKPIWKTTDAKLLAAIGPNERAQLWKTGYSTSSYIKCDSRRIFFAGPQRSRLVVASTEDGKLLWQKPSGNFQIVLRDDGFYAAGPQDAGRKMSYDGGAELATLPHRRACTRATGTLDSVFYRTSGGTVRIDVNTNTAEHIAPMRPPCQDGVMISDGHLYWGPWMCGCQLSLYGHVCLAPAGDIDRKKAASADSRLETGEGDPMTVEPLEATPDDWPCYLGDNGRSAWTEADVPRRITRKWTMKLSPGVLPTGPVTVGDIVFVADRAGVVRAMNADGALRWKAHTAAAIYYPPAVDDGRVYVGSADGRVYAFEATTGRLLWSYRVAPIERWICTYGTLGSTWPIAGGVVVQNGTVYAAAGIAHYDGTHVVALDARTGKPRWTNDTSGSLSKVSKSGVSLQGNLMIRDSELRFVGGGVCELARFDLKTGKCLNQASDSVQSRYHTAFYALYPTYGKFMSLDHTFADGKTLSYDATYEGSQHSQLALLAPLPPGQTRRPKTVSRWGSMNRRDAQPPKAVWTAKALRRFGSFVVTNDTLLAAGEEPSEKGPVPFLAAIDITSGRDLWREALPSPAVKGGTALDRTGRIFVTLENGELLAFE